MMGRAQSTGLCAVAGCERWAASGSKYCEPHAAERRAATSTATEALDLFGAPEPEPVGKVIPVQAHERHIKPRETPQRARLPDTYDGQAPFAPDSPTSRAAAASVEGEHVRTQMQRVYDYIVSQGERGATRQEVTDALGLLWQSCGARVRRLVQKGVIGSNGETRKSRMSDRDAEVLLAERYVTRWQADQARPADYVGITDDGEAPR